MEINMEFRGIENEKIHSCIQWLSFFFHAFWPSHEMHLSYRNYSNYLFLVLKWIILNFQGDQLHWIGCALYVACRSTSTPTVGRTSVNAIEGNCVSLTRLLKLCNLSLIQFFSKCKSWADMANMPQDFRTKIDKLERNFSVSMVIFQKYQPMFIDIFKNPNDDNSRAARSRRHKPMPCTPSRVFEFCWTLFICVKGAFPGISDDLVNSYHLLIGCCDLVYSNALMANRKDLLNPKFPGKTISLLLT